MTPQQAEELATLWTASQRVVAAFIRTLVPDFGEADDILQRVAVACWCASLTDYDSSRPFAPWAIGMAKWEVLAYRRERALDRHVFFNEGLIDRIADSYRQIVRRNDRRNARCWRSASTVSTRAPEKRSTCVMPRICRTLEIAQEMADERQRRPEAVEPGESPRSAIASTDASKNRGTGHERSERPRFMPILDDELTDADRRALETWLDEDPQHVDQFVAECHFPQSNPRSGERAGRAGGSQGRAERRTGKLWFCLGWLLPSAFSIQHSAFRCRHPLPPIIIQTLPSSVSMPFRPIVRRRPVFLPDCDLGDGGRIGSRLGMEAALTRCRRSCSTPTSPGNRATDGRSVGQRREYVGRITGMVDCVNGRVQGTGVQGSDCRSRDSPAELPCFRLGDGIALRNRRPAGNHLRFRHPRHPAGPGQL